MTYFLDKEPGPNKRRIQNARFKQGGVLNKRPWRLIEMCMNSAFLFNFF